MEPVLQGLTWSVCCEISEEDLSRDLCFKSGVSFVWFVSRQYVVICFIVLMICDKRSTDLFVTCRHYKSKFVK